MKKSKERNKSGRNKNYVYIMLMPEQEKVKGKKVQNKCKTKKNVIESDKGKMEETKWKKGMEEGSTRMQE